MQFTSHSRVQTSEFMPGLATLLCRLTFVLRACITSQDAQADHAQVSLVAVFVFVQNGFILSNDDYRNTALQARFVRFAEATGRADEKIDILDA